MSSSHDGNASSTAEFNELAYALSCIRHIREHVPSQPALTSDQKKHLKLLDDIALLLVTEEKGDVAAVSFQHTATSIEFYYSKNRSCTPKETEYVRTLLSMIRGYEPSERQEWTEKCVELVLRACIRKIKGRLRKITNELRKCGLGISSLELDDIDNLPVWCTTDHDGEIVRVLAEADSGTLPGPGVSDKQILVGYFRKVLEMSGPKNLPDNIPNLLAVVTLSLYIGFALRTDPVLNNPTLIRRIQKLGDYSGAVRSIARTLSDPNIYYQRDMIKITEIKAPEQRVCSMPGNFLEVVNKYAISQGKSRVQWGDLCNAFPLLESRPEPPEGDMKVTTSAHCECTVAIHMLQNTPTQHKTLEIGVSKRSCWLCQRYLEFLVETNSGLIPAHPARFIVSGCQGKIHSGWQLPSGHGKAAGRMIELITHEMDEILESMTRTNRSDSLPRSPDTRMESVEEGGGINKEAFSKILKDLFRN